MGKSYSMEVPARGRGEAPGAGGRRYRALTGGGRHGDRGGEKRYRDEDFPGCESFPLPASEVESYEGRLEFWDGHSETAWRVCEPTSLQHEGPSRRLVRMAERVASLRGSRIVAFGSADLVRRDAKGEREWLMQADEVLYLHPARALPRGSAIDVDTDPLPDVVLEVDHSTDVRRGKLEVYQESGFPEIWVLVPWESSRRRPGLVIHVRHAEGYREEGSSPAFARWRAEDIHRALTEEPLSAGARRALERVALAMGAREGTQPEDDPFTRSLTSRVRTQARAEAVLAALAARGIGPASGSSEARELIATLPLEISMAAVMACSDEADFRRRLREAAP